MAESSYPMVSVTQALDCVLEQAQPLQPQTVSLRDALGLILAEDVHAKEPLPPFPASVKDGYAVVATDGPGEYPVIGRAVAGQMPDFTVTPGTVAYITTGAPLPAGANAVVMVEQTRDLPAKEGTSYIQINQQVGAGDDVRQVGVDVDTGQKVLARGEKLFPAEVGLLATIGLHKFPFVLAHGLAFYPQATSWWNPTST